VLAYVPIATKTEEVDERKYASKKLQSDGGIANFVSCRDKGTVASSKRSDRSDQWKELEKVH